MWGRMIRHEQAGHDFAVDHVALHNFGDISLGFHAIPNTFRINDHTRPQGAVIKAAGFIGTHDIFQIQALGFVLEPGMQRFRSQFRAAASRVVRATLVDANENMTLERGQMFRCS